MARAIWSGTIGFGLVQIPVTLHTAEERDELDFTMLDSRDFSPVGYQRINKRTGKEVPWERIVKGYEHADGKYVVLTDADFAEANVEATHRVDILAFVEFSAIDPRYVERPYYVVPQKAGRKAYALLRETLRRMGKAGIGKVVIRSRQHLAAVIAQGDLLLLELLRFSDELRDASDLDVPDKNLGKLGVTSKELGMAEKLVAAMVEEFEPEQYEDEYRRDLMKLIQRKVKAGELNRIPEDGEAKPRPKAPPKVIDLASLLASSLSGGKAANRSNGGSETRAPKKLAKTKGGSRRKTSRGDGHRKSA
ncbi:MAG TPA: Ku protein [Polyangiaceae bacterium]